MSSSRVSSWSALPSCDGAAIVEEWSDALLKLKLPMRAQPRRQYPWFGSSNLQPPRSKQSATSTDAWSGDGGGHYKGQSTSSTSRGALTRWSHCTSPYPTPIYSFVNGSPRHRAGFATRRGGYPRMKNSTWTNLGSFNLTFRRPRPINRRFGQARAMPSATAASTHASPNAVA